HVRQLAPVLPPPDRAHRHGLRGWAVQVDHEHHAAHEVYEQVAGDARAELAPTAPAREEQRIEGPLGRAAEPGVPVEVLQRKIWWRRILPRAGRTISPEPPLDHREITDGALRDQLARLGTDRRAHAL